MPLIATGISHHTAPLEVREKLAIPADAYAACVSELCEIPGISEAVIISTCNRTEIYAVVSQGHERDLKSWLLGHGGLDVESADKLVYEYTDREAVAHLFRVASGLDSLVLGEPQILGQLKDAWESARIAGSAGKLTDRLFQRAFAASKEVRAETGINDHPVSVAYIATILARQIFGDLGSKNVLLVGAGEMITLCGRHFRQGGTGRLMIANRSLERAATLAKRLGGEALSLADLGARMQSADIIITSTSSREPVIDYPSVRSALRAKRGHPMFIVDLGVPRDVDPDVAELRDVYLYSIDDLRQVADESLEKRRDAAQTATVIIEAAVQEYLRWLHGARAAEGLRRLRSQAERDSKQLAMRALHQIEAGGNPAAVVQQLSMTLTHRILHGPSTRLREAAENEHYDILKAADWLFDSSPDDEGTDSESE